MKIKLWKLRNKIGLKILTSKLIIFFKIYFEIPICGRCKTSLITVKLFKNSQGIHRRQTCYTCDKIVYSSEKKITKKQFEKELKSHER